MKYGLRGLKFRSLIDAYVSVMIYVSMKTWMRNERVSGRVGGRDRRGSGGRSQS